MNSKDAESTYKKIYDSLMEVAKTHGFKKESFLIKLSKNDIDKVLSKYKTSLSEIQSRPYDSEFSLIRLNDGNYALTKKPELKELIKNENTYRL